MLGFVVLELSTCTAHACFDETTLSASPYLPMTFDTPSGRRFPCGIQYKQPHHQHHHRTSAPLPLHPFLTLSSDVNHFKHSRAHHTKIHTQTSLTHFTHPRTKPLYEDIILRIHLNSETD
ncbi:hypothetical protein M011DRAFT_118831 [Sporormia fimetaria CBS 119925]|uniref:Uncharacterized protein n=1 Tax=Sporormia fimetaria CBS 119925 TaxID=1340428 RepID=A0A6A6VLZ2_9PLEO|nr:hypothetical protein M011DRAFT_118831 [Sporormia fimetaria CBS 119925]